MIRDYNTNAFEKLTIDLHDIQTSIAIAFNGRTLKKCEKIFLDARENFMGNANHEMAKLIIKGAINEALENKAINLKPEVEEYLEDALLFWNDERFNLEWRESKRYKRIKRHLKRVEKVGQRFFDKQCREAEKLSELEGNLNNEIIHYLLQAKNYDEFEMLYCLAHDFLIVKGCRFEGYFNLRTALLDILDINHYEHVANKFGKAEGFLTIEVEQYILERITNCTVAIIDYLQGEDNQDTPQDTSAH
jgi:hypothetical protein